MNKLRHILILVLFTLICNIAFAQIEYTVQKTHDSEILFFVDNIKEDIPESVINQLAHVPLPELDDGIIYYLIATNKYLNVSVKEMLNKNQNKKLFLVTAHYAKKIHSIIFEGINSSEQISFQKDLSLQSGKDFKEYLISNDVKNVENNLHGRGYANAVVKGFRVQKLTNKNVNLIYQIEKGQPCRIDQIVIENSRANILNFINLPIETGSLCDLASVNDKLDQIKNNYWRQGYLTAETNIKNIGYSSNKERAKLVLYIEKGPQTVVQIEDEKNNYLSSDFLNSKQSALTYTDLLSSSDEELVDIISKYYKNLGYPYSTVHGPNKIQDKDGDIILKFIVNRGIFVKIGTIFFVGELPEDKGKILKELKLDKSFFARDIPFVQNDLPLYRERLKSIFYRNGYADASIPVPDFNFVTEGHAANLVFNVSSGDKYILDNINIENLPVGFNPHNGELDSIINLGGPINFDNKQAYVDRLRSQLFDKGYIYAQVKLEQIVKQSDLGLRLVSLTIKVDSGPLVKIGKIFAQGDLFNKEKEIISISGLEEGNVFSQRQLDAARNRILRHELFSSVAVEAMDSFALDRKEPVLDVIIRTRARSGYLLTLSPGWGNYRGYRFGVDYSLNQITEDGLRLIAGAQVSQEKQQTSFATGDTQQILGQQINLGFTEPLFKLGNFYTPLDLSSVAGYQVAAETLTNREYQTLKFIAEWKPTFFDYNWIFSSTFIHEKSTAKSSENAVIQTIDSPSLVIREILNSISIDTRNNLAWPTNGGLFSFGFGMARFGISSDVQYNRYLPKADIYFPIYEKLSGAVLTGGVFVSDTLNQSGETVTPPASRRGTLTGNALIRGFPETYGSAAPGPLLWLHYNQNSGAINCNTQLAAVGSTNLLFLKTEGRYRFNDVFGMVAFVDSGVSYLKKTEVDQVNGLIGVRSKTASTVPGQCTVNSAYLVAPVEVNYEHKGFVNEYWKEAYISTGLGLRVILGNFAAISLDYGYPLKDPAQHGYGCMTPTEALAFSPTKPDDHPTCISRIQNSSYNLLFTKFSFKGAVHLGIGASF